MLLKRTLSDYIDKAAKGFPVITISGPRQSGKSTFVKMKYPDFLLLFSLLSVVALLYRSKRKDVNCLSTPELIVLIVESILFKEGI